VDAVASQAEAEADHTTAYTTSTISTSLSSSDSRMMNIENLLHQLAEQNQILIGKNRALVDESIILRSEVSQLKEKVGAVDRMIEERESRADEIYEEISAVKKQRTTLHQNMLIQRSEIFSILPKKATLADMLDIEGISSKICRLLSVRDRALAFTPLQQRMSSYDVQSRYMGE
jgi:hypothetical protein